MSSAQCVHPDGALSIEPGFQRIRCINCREAWDLNPAVYRSVWAAHVRGVRRQVPSAIRRRFEAFEVAVVENAREAFASAPAVHISDLVSAFERTHRASQNDKINKTEDIPMLTDTAPQDPQPYADDEEPEAEEAVSQISPAELQQMIDETGLSQREWARKVAGRASRTVRKWLKGGPIASDACSYLRHIERVKVTATTITITVVR